MKGMAKREKGKLVGREKRKSEGIKCLRKLRLKGLVVVDC